MRRIQVTGIKHITFGRVLAFGFAGYIVGFLLNFGIFHNPVGRALLVSIMYFVVPFVLQLSARTRANRLAAFFIQWDAQELSYNCGKGLVQIPIRTIKEADFKLDRVQIKTTNGNYTCDLVDFENVQDRLDISHFFQQFSPEIPLA